MGEVLDKVKEFEADSLQKVKEFKLEALRNLFEQCTEEQQKRFHQMYPKFPIIDSNMLNTAIMQCERTVNLNEKKITDKSW